MIRRAKNSTKEIDAIHKLITDAAVKHSILPRSKEEIKEVIDCFFVAEEGGKIAGCCAIEIYSPKLAEIRSLVVLSEFRQNGIGKLLVDVCLQEAKEKNVYEVLTITDKDAFFEKAGFSKCLNGQWAMFVKLK